MIRPENVARFFAPDYAAARSRFRDQAAARGFQLEAHPIAATGPKGEELTIDVARAGDEQASAVVIVSSGLHGVEGYSGAAVQLALLLDEHGVGGATAERGIGADPRAQSLRVRGSEGRTRRTST